ncbi:MAG: NAD(P)H-binding protein [Blastocatellia bacterium]
MPNRNIFIAGGTGYIGSRLIPRLLNRGHRVRGLTRSGSIDKLPQGCEAVIGDPLDSDSFVQQIRPSDTFVQLVGVPKPSPAKGAQFRAVDLPAIRAAVPAAVEAGIEHFVYVSVAHPAPIMKSYIEVRTEGEELIRKSGLKATVLRPWYVLGPGHRWPYALLPAYAILERIPSTRDTALRLGLVTLDQMLNALAESIETPAEALRILEVPGIRNV